MNLEAPQEKTPHNVNMNYIPQVYINRLLTHMEMYVNCGMISRAKKLLIKYTKSMQHKVQDSRNHIKFYNLLLQAYASKGNMLEAEHLYTEIKNNSLTPTPQTYVYILDGLARVKNDNNWKGNYKLQDIKTHINILKNTHFLCF